MYIKVSLRYAHLAKSILKNTFSTLSYIKGRPNNNFINDSTGEVLLKMT